MARTLAEFEPATTTLEPERTRDLLKKLYQYLGRPQEEADRPGLWKRHFPYSGFAAVA